MQVNLKRRILGLGLLALAVVGCATERPTRSFVQPNYLSKDMFAGEWYYRQTVVDVPATHSILFGGYTFNMEKVRWEVQENWLVAYRSYELVPGSARQADQENKGVSATRYAPNEQEGRNPGFKEAPIAAFPISKHFDIFRQYNSTTGEEINVLEENDRDRPWYERKYMRIDWSANQVVNLSDWSKAFANWFSSAWWVQESEKTRESFRIDGERDAKGQLLPAKVNYFDFVSRLFFTPDDYGCYFAAYDGTDCTASDVKLRSSFLKVDGARDFEPVVYDDRKMSKFGYFRTERLSYNRNRGVTQSGRIYLANVHNIWKNSYERDAQGNVKYMDGTGTNARPVFYSEKDGFHYRAGNVASGAVEKNAAGVAVTPAAILPMYSAVEKRTPKPIVYMLSPNYPQSMISVTEKVTDSWNLAFRTSVAAAQNRDLNTGAFNTSESCQKAFGAGGCSAVSGGFWKTGATPDKIPDMYVLGYNGWVKTLGGKQFTDYKQSEQAGLTGTPTWTYDRTKEVFQLGDLRYNTVAWIHQNQLAGPLGYGPSSADPETGEIISGMAHMYGAAVDTYASFALDSVKLLNNQVTLDDVVTGRSVADYITRQRDRLDPRNRLPGELRQMPAATAMRTMLGEKKLAKLDTIRRHGLPRAPVGAGTRTMDKIMEHGLDRHLINEEIRIQTSKGTYQPNQPLTAEELKRINFQSWGSPQALKARIKARQTWALKQNITLAEFTDDSIQGLAQEFRNRSLDDLADGGKVWQELRERIYRGLAEHEIGHTIGLRHNFQGSYDSLNYHDQFWDLRKENLSHLPPIVQDGASLQQLVDMQARTPNQIAGKISEYQYSTVMDYGARFNSDVHGVGKYDIAAIAFAYAGAVQVFDFDKARLDESTQKVMDFVGNKPSPIYDNLYDYVHYTQLPYKLVGDQDDVEGGVQAMRARRWVKWADLQKARADNAAAASLEVPYMFCSDEWIGSIGSCQLWDQGADHSEITQDIIQRYNQYYFFNNYKRDRHAFDAFNVLQRVWQRYLSYLPNMYQNWLFNEAFGKDLDENDGVTRDTIGDTYWTISTYDGFNQLAETLVKPSYGAFQKYRDLNDDVEYYGLYSYSMLNGEDDTVDVPRGDGRRLYSRYDFQSGYYLFDQTLEAGHFWDWLAALFSIVTTEATVLGVETASDFTSYVIPYHLVFEDEMIALMNGIIARDYTAVGPRINGTGEMKNKPAIAYLSSMENVPGTPVDADINFTQQIYAALYAFSSLNSNYSLAFADQAHIFRVNPNEQVNPGPGWHVESYTHPDSGRVYGCVKRDVGVDKSLAWKYVGRQQRLLGIMNNPNASASARQNARSAFDDNQTDIDILRDLYPIFGHVFY